MQFIDIMIRVSALVFVIFGVTESIKEAINERN